MSPVLKCASTLALLALAACAGPPPSPALGLTPENPTTTDDLVLAITDAADLDVDVTYDVTWYVDGAEAPDLFGSETVPADRTSKGEQWKVEVLAVDTKERLSAAVDLAVTILNTPPTATVALEGSEAATEDDLVATVAGQDVDDDTLTYSWTWLRDGADAGIGSDTVPASETQKGEVWTVRVVPNDGETDGEAAEATVSIGNTVPVALGVTLQPDEVYEATTLTALPEGTDADDDAIEWSFVWSVDGITLPKTDDDQLTGASFDKGQRISVQVTPSDGLTDGEPVTSDEIVVRNTPPSIERATLSPTTAAEDTTLACDATGWRDDDGDAEGYNVTWEVNGSVVSSAATLSGADFDKGDSVVCVLVPWDGEDEGEARSTEALTVANTPPVLAGVTIGPTSPKEGDTLSATLGSVGDIDGDKITYTYAWYVDGKVAGTDTTLDSGSFDKGQEVYLQVTPNDGEEDGIAVSSATVTAVNTAPELTSVTLSPTTARTNDTLTATASATDADGDSVSYSYAWTVNGTAVSETGSTLSGASDFDKGDVIVVTVTPNDGEEDGKPMSSGSVTILNTAPRISSATVSPTSPTTSSTLACTPSGWSDDDKDKAGYEYAWRKNGSLISGATSSTLASTNFERSDKLTCEVTPYDGEDRGTMVAASTVTVVNEAPSLSSVSLAPSSPKTADTLKATATGASDSDGDEVTLVYRWYVNSTLVATATTTSTSTSLSSSIYEKGDKVFATVTPYDGTAYGTLRTSPTVTVVNTAPVIGSVAVAPSTLYTTTTALSSYSGVSDADGDSLTGTWEWTVDGTAVGGNTTSLASSFFKKGQKVAFTLTVSDGTDKTSKTAAAVTVSNSLPTAPAMAISPGTPKDADALTCALSTAATDADGDSLSYDIDWYVDGKLWTGGTSTTKLTGDTIAAADTKEGQVWYCVGSAYDGSAYGPDGTSAKVTILPDFSPPKVGTTGTYGVTTTPSYPDGNPWLVCRADTSTAWVAANSRGIYAFHDICKSFGYVGADAWGGTCGTVCGYCGSAGSETYGTTGTVGALAGNYSSTQVYYTVHWRCRR